VFTQVESESLAYFQADGARLLGALQFVGLPCRVIPFSELVVSRHNTVQESALVSSLQVAHVPFQSLSIAAGEIIQRLDVQLIHPAYDLIQLLERGVRDRGAWIGRPLPPEDAGDVSMDVNDRVAGAERRALRDHEHALRLKVLEWQFRGRILRG